MTTTEPITSDQLKALRNARSVNFRYNATTHLVDVRATREYDPKDGFGPRELAVEFPIQGLINTYKNPTTNPKAQVVTAYWGLSYASIEDTWRTALHHVRVGDELIVRWAVAGGESEKLRTAGFTTVDFTLEVVRTTTKDRKYMHFLLGYSIEPLDSPAPAVGYGMKEYTLNVD